MILENMGNALKSAYLIVSPYFFNFIFALVIFFAGLLLAKLLQFMITYLLQLVKLDQGAKTIKFSNILTKAEIKRTVSELAGDLVYWIILIGAFVSGIIAIGHPVMSTLFKEILIYVSINVVSATVVLILVVLFGKFIANLILLFGNNIELPGTKTIAKSIQYAVVLFGIYIALEQLGVPMEAVITKTDILVGSIALALAIAFGLGCKDLAGNFLSDLFKR